MKRAVRPGLWLSIGSPWASTPALLVVLAVACGGGETHEMPDYGAACSGSCANGLACLPTPDGTGYCTSTCEAGSCPTGTACNSAFGAAVCFSMCATDADCHAGQQCYRGLCQPGCGDDAACGGGGATCVSGRCQGPECASATDCGAGMVCTGGRCVMPTDGGGANLPDGTACTTSADCASGTCIHTDTGGVCSVACTNGDTCFFESWSSACGVDTTMEGAFGTFCVPYRPGVGTNGSYCTEFAGCDNSACIQNQCRAVCESDAGCLLGQHCTLVTFPGAGDFMGCGYDAGPASGTRVDVLPLGDYAVAANTGTPNLVFATAPDTISVTLRAVQTGGDPLDMYFYDVFDAAGQIYSLAGISTYVDQPIRWYPFDAASAVAMLIPNATTDHYTFHPGYMRFSMAAYGASASATGTVDMHVDAVIVRAATAPTTGTLNLRIHLVGVGVTAATASASARVNAFLSRFSAILGMVGISVGNVTFVDVNAPALAIIDTADGEGSELSQLFRTSTATSENVVNLFLVQEVRAGDSGEFNTLGIAGGIPGPPGIHGSSHSGVVIAFDSGVVGTGTAGGDLAGHVAAHEVGHFLGLFHTSEMPRPCGPGEVPSATNVCAPFGGTDVIGDTTYGDSSNLMHYVVTGPNWNMTAGQGFVELRNPLTR